MSSMPQNRLRLASALDLLVFAVREGLDRVEQWSNPLHLVEHPQYAFEYTIRLRAAVEWLEIYDCGSTGGFGKDQPEGQHLLERARWLLEKYTP